MYPNSFLDVSENQGRIGTLFIGANRPISIYWNSAQDNILQYEALGNKPHKLCSYSHEPRTEVYCLRLNFNVCTLDLVFLRPDPKWRSKQCRLATKSRNRSDIFFASFWMRCWSRYHLCDSFLNLHETLKFCSAGLKDKSRVADDCHFSLCLCNDVPVEFTRVWGILLFTLEDICTSWRLHTPNM